MKKQPSNQRGTFPKAMDFNNILNMDLKELSPEHREGGYKYILQMINKFSKYTKALCTDPRQRSRNFNKCTFIGLQTQTSLVVAYPGFTYTVITQENCSAKNWVQHDTTPQVIHHTVMGHTVYRQFEKSYSEAKGSYSTQQSLAEALFAADTNIRPQSGFSPLQVLRRRQSILPTFLRTEDNTPEVI